MPVGGEAVGAGTATGHRGSLGGAAPTGFTSREELRKQRELEEARKSGLAPAEKDEEGRDINPHIPQYIAKAPWYLNQERPSLKHQRGAHGQVQAKDISSWYRRGVIGETQPRRYRKGACVNCGAMTHDAKTCTERPRKLGARWTATGLAPDELIPEEQDVTLDFDGKRDRYGGYDPDSYKHVIKEYDRLDTERKRRRVLELQEQISKADTSKTKRKLKKRLSEMGAGGEGQQEEEEEEEEELREGATESAGKGGAEDEGGGVGVGAGAVDTSSLKVTEKSEQNVGGSDDDDDEDDDEEGVESRDEDVKVREFDQTNAPIGTKDDRTRTTTRNLRIREDTAKYLYNLDVNSAFYDPKTRSMRDNPLRHLGENEQLLFKGDNAVRMTGEAAAVHQMEVFAWEAYKRGANVHSQALPTQLELMHKEHLQKRKELGEQKREELLDKYGGKEHLSAPKELIYGQTEMYIEYHRDGSVAQVGKPVPLLSSKYAEDVLYGDHGHIWGSYYDRKSGMWGYACCRKTTRSDPYCPISSGFPLDFAISAPKTVEEETPKDFPSAGHVVESVMSPIPA